MTHVTGRESDAGVSTEREDSVETSANNGAATLPKDEFNRFNGFVVSLQSLLFQFAHPEVRSAFTGNKFGWRVNTSLLPKIDRLRCTLFPRWEKNCLSTVTGRQIHAIGHMKLLYTKSEQPFQVSAQDEDELLTYSEWYEVIDLIGRDDFWQKYSESSCSHFINASTSVKDETTGAIPKLKKDRIISTSSASSGSVDSDDETDSDTSSIDTKSSHANRKRREVVTPPKFEMNGKVSLKEYFQVYESYFIGKFNGTEFDQTQELANFIDGKLLEVYNIMGGRRLGYKKMKDELLKWYSKQRIGGKTYWREQFLRAVPEPEESLDLYGMRLIEIFQLAYPKADTQNSKELRARFLTTVSSAISSRITDAERVMKAASGGGKRRMEFSALVEMAHELQLEQPKVVNWVRQMEPAERSVSYYRDDQPSKQQTRNSYTRTRTVSNERSNEANQKIKCSFCGRLYHTVDNCWRALKLCLICGGKHEMKECPKHNDNGKVRYSERALNE